MGKNMHHFTMNMYMGHKQRFDGKKCVCVLCIRLIEKRRESDCDSKYTGLSNAFYLFQSQTSAAAGMQPRTLSFWKINQRISNKNAFGQINFSQVSVRRCIIFHRYFVVLSQKWKGFVLLKWICGPVRHLLGVSSKQCICSNAHLLSHLLR